MIAEDYRKIKFKHGLSGMGNLIHNTSDEENSIDFPYYNDMDQLYGSRPGYNIEGIDSLDESINSVDESINSSDDKIYQKDESMLQDEARCLSKITLLKFNY